MMQGLRYSDTDRSHVLEAIEQGGCRRVLDIGASMGTWSSEVATHYIDIMEWPAGSAKGFIGRLSSRRLWDEVLDYVKINGKFDFIICSHTLEDISCPDTVCEIMPQIGHRGFVAVPSKYAEFRMGAYSLGYIHHRWIFNKEGERFVGYPKLGFLERWDFSDLKGKSDMPELQFFWDCDFSLDLINDDYLGPDEQSVVSYYRSLLAS